MGEEKVELVPAGALTAVPASYVIDFNGQRRQFGGIRYRLGHNVFNGPVALKITVEGEAGEQRLRRELEVTRYLGVHGGELLSKCLAYEFGRSSASALVTYRGRPLADVMHDEASWPLDYSARAKIIVDLLRGVELLRVSSIVHGAISMNTLHWDGTTLQIVDFGQAALCGSYPDGRLAHHGDDVEAVGRVIYHIHTGQPPPEDPATLRRQLEQVQDAELRDFLLRRDLVRDNDIDYVFASAPDGRPTARVLLRRLDRRPHGIQRQRLLAREQAVRTEFTRLRERQEHFRRGYRSWVAERARAGSFRWPYPVARRPYRRVANSDDLARRAVLVAVVVGVVMVVLLGLVLGVLL